MRLIRPHKWSREDLWGDTGSFRYMKQTNISVDKDDKHLLDAAAKEIFGTERVSYRRTILHLIDRGTKIEMDPEK